MSKRTRSVVAIPVTGRVAILSMVGAFAVAAACGDTDETTQPPEVDASVTIPGSDGGSDATTVNDTSTPDQAVAETSADVNEASTVDASDAGDAGDASDASDANIADAKEAGADGGTACSGTSDGFWSQVLAYVPCTTGITDVSGQSAVTLYNTPTVSATPAGAPGGASCSLGNGGTIATAKGFSVTMPSAIGTSDFTVEVSVYQTAYSDPTDQQSEILIGTSYPPAAGGFPAFFSHKTVNKVQFIGGSAGTSYTDTGSALSTWEHYAASRVAGTTYVFRNGTLLTSFADPSNYTNTVFHSGHQANGSYNAVMGSVGQIRVTKAGRYTTSYQTCAAGFASN